jgi:hypothetical protein
MHRLFALLVVLFITKINSAQGDFRAPAVPLIVFSPHISGQSYLNFIINKKTMKRFYLNSKK